MATRKTKSKPTTAAAPVDKARKLWLAGLGALSIVRKQGADLLAGLTAEGQDFQTRARKIAHAINKNARAQLKGVITPLRARLKRDVKKAGAGLQRGVAAGLSQLGVPSKADIEDLTHRVAAISRKLKTVK